MAKNPQTQIFKGRTYTEALVKAKTKLGKDISIVNRRDVRESNLFSKLTSGKLGGDSLSVELEVALAPPEEQGESAAASAPNPLLRSYAKAVEGMERHSPRAVQAMAAAAAPFASVGESASGIAGRLDEFQNLLERNTRENADLRDELRMMLSLQARGGVPAVPPQFLEGYRRLVDAEVGEALAREIVEELGRERAGLEDPDAIRECLAEGIARRIPVAGPLLPATGRPTVIALVGASGVGKTTAVVKLAIQFAMHGRKSVGVINEDMRRPGADGQINNLGRLFGIPVTTASEPGEVADVVRSFAGRDLILLDTGGRSPRDEKGILELGGIIRAAGADETHLVLSGVSSERTMRETVRRFAPSGFDRILFSKLDECLGFGFLANVGGDLETGLSYITTGPDYTRPIEAAERSFLAGLVLGVREIGTGPGMDAEKGEAR